MILLGGNKIGNCFSYPQRAFWRHGTRQGRIIRRKRKWAKFTNL